MIGMNTCLLPRRTCGAWSSIELSAPGTGLQHNKCHLDLRLVPEKGDSETVVLHLHDMNNFTFHGRRGSAVFMRTLRHHLFVEFLGTAIVEVGQFLRETGEVTVRLWCYSFTT